MSKVLVILLLVMGAVFLSPLVVAQGNVRVHGGGAESLVNDCAAVDRMDVQAKTAPIKDAQGISYCFGYIFGVLDMRDILNSQLANIKDGVYCVPDNASATQLAKVVAKYGNEHPAELNQAALLMVTRAFIQSFPCN
jgi:Rap1a immunity proteins